MAAASSDFVHLHLHTDYSLLDGACAFEKPDKKSKAPLPELLKEYGMSACAITDHGFMGGCFAFFEEMNANKIKPILGCEMYLARGSRFDRGTENREYAHLVLLAKDFEGYQNLCHLMTRANTEGFYYKPRIDKELLSRYSKGIIGLSACLAGEIPRALLHGTQKEAYALADQYIQIFGKENFFIEIQDHHLAEQKLVNTRIIPLAKDLGLPLVATNDVHYLRKEHADAHDLLLCIGTKAKQSDERRFRFESKEFYLKTEEEMRALFPDHPEAITNTRLVAEMCNCILPTVDNTKGLSHYPVYDVRDSGFEDQQSYLRSLTMDGVRERYDFDPAKDPATYTEFEKKVMDRVEYELGIIHRMGFDSYYLVVWDFLHYARKEKIPVGPGRGSGAGSIVAYCVHITDIEPLRYNLLFERFLNPERVSPPDFDIDFCERRRGEVIKYVRHKYGMDSVSQIGTYGTLKPKAAIKDVARVLGKPPQVADRITKTLEGSPDTLDAETIKANPNFAKLLETDPEVRYIIEKATPLFNLNRNMTMHAAGVIIGDQPLDNVVPLSVTGDNNDELLTQFSSIPCEHMGLLKMDFLGLRTLTICQDAVDLIKQSRGIDIDLSKIPVDDKAAYELISRGDTVGVFQMESGGMRKLCRDLQPEKLEEIIALVALYRPGPMNFIPNYIEGKRNPVSVTYVHKLLEGIAAETNGILVYQEQVMQVAREVAGYSLGGADILRRAMGKKKPEEMEKQEGIFVKGAFEKNNIPEEKAREIFAILKKFAEYGFNKSHSAAYALVAYRTAYLKANYPVEFMAAVLTGELSHAEKMHFFIGECNDMGIQIKGPDVNTSYTAFSVDNGCVRFGLAAIKGVGPAATDAIIAERKANGKFTSFQNFCDRCVSALSEAAIESLIRSGAFDSFGKYRSQYIAVLSDALKRARQTSKDNAGGQDNFFDLMGSDDGDDAGLDLVFPDIDELDEAEMLKDEDRLIGFWISGHPLAQYESILHTYASHKIFELTQDTSMEDAPDIEQADKLLPNDTPVRIAGIIRSVQNKVTKTGKPMVIFSLEDLSGRMDCLCIGKTLEEHLPESFVLPEVQTAPLPSAAAAVTAHEKSAKIVEQDVFSIVNGAFEMVENKPDFDNKAAEPPLTTTPETDEIVRTITERERPAQKVETHAPSVRDLLHTDALVMIEGSLSRKEGQSASVFVERVLPLQCVEEQCTQAVHILLEEAPQTEDLFPSLIKILHNHPGSTDVVLRIKTHDGHTVFMQPTNDLAIRCSTDCIAQLRACVGDDHLRLKPAALKERRKRYQPQPKEA